MKSALNLFLFLFLFSAIVFASALSHSGSATSADNQDSPGNDSALLAYLNYFWDSINTTDSTVMVMKMRRVDSAVLADSIHQAEKEAHKKK